MPNTAMTAVPSMLTRIWRKLGFRYHLGNEPEGVDGLPGWMRTEVRMSFDWRDRLRLLATGRLSLTVVLYTDTPSPEICKSRIDYQIIPPWRRLT